MYYRLSTILQLSAAIFREYRFIFPGNMDLYSLKMASSGIWYNKTQHVTHFRPITLRVSTERCNKINFNFNLMLARIDKFSAFRQIEIIFFILNKQDEIISIIRRVDDSWVEGRLGDRIGIFPISFVEVLHTLISSYRLYSIFIIAHKCLFILNFFFFYFKSNYFGF